MRLIMHSSMLIIAVLQLAVIHPTASTGTSTVLAPHEISYLVLSQSSAFYARRALALRQSILEQQAKLAKFNDQPVPPELGTHSSSDNVHLSHELFADHEGSWAITPILKHIRASILKASHAGTRWLIICEENSQVNVSLLAHHLSKEDYRQELFLGYPLYDREATIIHHFAFFKNPSSFLYPYLRAGVALTVPLVDRLIQVLSSAGSTLTEFIIDAAHEFALLAWNRGTGSRLTPVSYLCARFDNTCAIYAGPTVATEATIAETGEPVASGAPHILFAVKTCAKFHEERVPVLLHTWAQYVRHLRLYSDTGDVSIPTIATSIPNTSIGHCAKTLEILHLINEEIFHNSSLADVRWIMLVDDDTILSPSALVRHLSCFDFNKDVYLGERYGYHLLTTRGDGTAESGYGYNYITGGGGIVISVTILDALLRSCECPSASSPDDMIIAACLYRLGVRPVHSPLFHQARPSDYPPEILGPDSISFHKHWQIDPYHVYNRWFRLNDELWYRQNTDRVTIENTVNNKPLLHPNHICNENDSTRQPFNRLSHAIGNVAAPAHDKHSNQQPPSDGKHSATTATTSMANRYQTEHIGNPFCESNELQSNSNLLLNRHHEVSSHSLQQPNIIKHTEL
ncbi:beta-1,3-glucosyltransferase isoform X1 [Sabethes cyaneus]|uniref:beta-1,3-glucosyltransferase isoform X1 n=1 Tax=Sabethes cyaneus TaxID=53552 RepID=UPI00237E9732|nr:beta-1,3-glucosyltransferase isoform X1 [Sabethes cyaneus]XP_053693638.1 beta-1,3-glucosyltransferase isoform X1 [Sabethes cyaneus]XP_053693640.1 beta-1,3-glucosyltransferase isoform X1 [Sabethes cyaneus]XP_053693641.1 beta-1,3-glucosyltransferase isoform X1 [Sabethes cyaneus]XP_053693642.1 beta-1,3-glucosyltransferase isoform X1 [Sabethes cyaneus]XP_053693643.1 beta-1,3-glucosyltransferase isoform X1 [Sabethes cyaneus]XP_053693644.1 beta-1,3-glucosyltransferase isoform X1 [Sabethes cyaneu